MGNTITTYEGYGRTKGESLISLASMVRYNHEQTTLHEELDGKEHNVPSGRYYIWDGVKKHYVHFTMCNNRYRAFIQ